MVILGFGEDRGGWGLRTNTSRIDIPMSLSRTFGANGRTELVFGSVIDLAMVCAKSSAGNSGAELTVVFGGLSV